MSLAYPSSVSFVLRAHSKTGLPTVVCTPYVLPTTPWFFMRVADSCKRESNLAADRKQS
jgi:hypothetical protein